MIKKIVLELVIQLSQAMLASVRRERSVRGERYVINHSFVCYKPFVCLL